MSKLKALARRILGPFARPILFRIRRFTGVRAEIDNLANAWHQQVPGIVNTAASLAALAREHARMKKDHEARIAALEAEIRRLSAAQAGESRPLEAPRVPTP